MTNITQNRQQQSLIKNGDILLYLYIITGQSLFIHNCIGKYYIFQFMDSKLTLVTEQTGDGFYIAQFKTSELAIYSYYVESQKQTILIDPVLDVKVYSDFITKRQTVLKYVFLTHYHADYLSGHTEYKVPIVMGPDSKRAQNKFAVKQCKDGEVLGVGNVRITVLHTPGHTLESSCYVLNDSNKTDAAIFTGDTVFLGEVGRPDLAGNQKITPADLAGLLYDSIQKLKKLERNMRVYPGHGSGSACGKSIAAGNFCTMANQHETNYGFKFKAKEEFVKQVSQNIPKPPKYFFFDAGLNQSGSHCYKEALTQANVPLNEHQFSKLKSTVRVVDTRVNDVEGIIRGSYWLPGNGAIANWVSNFFGPEEQFIIITDEGKEQDIIDRFFRIGYFKIRGFNNFKISELKEELVKTTILKFHTLKELQEFVHVDVRSLPEYRTDGVVDGAILIPLSELQARVEELKGKKNLVTNCLTGNRARVAFSVLAKHGIESKIIVEHFKQYKNNGINVVDFKG